MNKVRIIPESEWPEVVTALDDERKASVRDNFDYALRLAQFIGFVESQIKTPTALTPAPAPASAPNDGGEQRRE